jgi:hypothetical protein
MFTRHFFRNLLLYVVLTTPVMLLLMHGWPEIYSEYENSIRIVHALGFLVLQSYYSKKKAE